MCTVSMIGDFYRDKWKDWDPMRPLIPQPIPGQVIPAPEITKQEFDELRKEVQDMKELLRRAKIYDEENGETDCEIDEKMDLLRRIAKLVGVDLEDVLNAS